MVDDTRDEALIRSQSSKLINVLMPQPRQRSISTALVFVYTKSFWSNKLLRFEINFKPFVYIPFCVLNFKMIIPKMNADNFDERQVPNYYYKTSNHSLCWRDVSIHPPCWSICPDHPTGAAWRWVLLLQTFRRFYFNSFVSSLQTIIIL